MDDSWIQMDAANPYQTKTFLLLFQLRKFRSNGNDFFKYWTFSFKNFSEIFCAFLLELDKLELDTDHEGYSVIHSPPPPLPTHPEQVPLGIGVNGKFFFLPSLIGWVEGRKSSSSSMISSLWGRTSSLWGRTSSGAVVTGGWLDLLPFPRPAGHPLHDHCHFRC